MKKLKSTILIILLIITVGVLIPKIFIRDSHQLSQDDHDTIISTTYTLLNNPLEWLLIQKIAVDNQVGNNVYISAYTFWGIKYAIIQAGFDGDSKVLWRRWFAK